MFSKVIEYLERNVTANRLEMINSSKQMNRVQNIQIETYKYEYNHIRLVLADLTCTLFFYKNKSLDLSKKIKNKLRPKLDILSHRV